MKQCLVRSCSVGASSILAVAVAAGMAATPAFAGTPHTASSVHAQQNRRTLSAPVKDRSSYVLIHTMKLDPRMC
jgi:hypothetical protein